ncbi:MAG TPA: DUF2884 family protein [Frateuria sp.]|uniref:DUF2884 family protein n=1 Tax=Frateuria sp. TaxID=2211372 RepID=UPI002D7F9DA0|nr:DUF2884 family protein [Frateuria sp.]HET6806766.1 DUF2884 family protein [Frateuria sp.]
MPTRNPIVFLAFAAGLLLAGCSNGSFSSTTIADGGIVVRGDKVTLFGKGGSEGVLDGTGRLVVDGRDVTVDATQRQLLQRYYQSAQAVREHGMATGKAGVAVAVQSLKKAAAHVAGGDDGKADTGLDAATKRVHQEASRICQDISEIRIAQDRLATSLPAFKPFAGIVDHDGSDCPKGS